MIQLIPLQEKKPVTYLNSLSHDKNMEILPVAKRNQKKFRWHRRSPNASCLTWIWRYRRPAADHRRCENPSIKVLPRKIKMEHPEKG